MPDGTELAYRMVGGGPDTVVVVHGGPGLQMQYLVREWAPLAHGRTLIFYDQRGRGQSDPAPDSTLSASADADDLEGLRAALGLGRFDLAAHHSGAAVAALYTRRHPAHVRRLLLVSPGWARRSYLFWAAAAVPNDSVATDRVSRAIHSHENISDPVGFCRQFWGFWFSPVEVTDPVVIRRLAPGVCDATPERLLATDRINDRIYRSAYGLNLQDSLATIAVPALVIHGESDSASMSSAQRWASWLPQGRELLISKTRAGLFPWVDQEAVFFRAVNEFLSGGWPAASSRPVLAVDSVTTTSRVK
jgi:proline iminopeptidase